MNDEPIGKAEALKSSMSRLSSTEASAAMSHATTPPKPFLSPGDRVALLAPASQLPTQQRVWLEPAERLLSAWGLRVEPAYETQHHFYLAGADALRAQHLSRALADPGVQGLFVVRGGYGCARLLPYLDAMQPQGDKVLVGCSDITALHLALVRRWPQLARIHGPELVTAKLLAESEPEAALNRQSLQRALMTNRSELWQDLELWRPPSWGNQGAWSMSAPVIGGNLTVLASLLGTPDAARTDGHFLFLEEVGEAPYRVDRLLTQLRGAGCFQGVRALLLGEFTRCDDGMNDLRDVILDAVGPVSFPIIAGLPCGHGARNRSLPLGQVLQLSCSSAGALSLAWTTGRAA